jgi:hypothetical protein
MDDLDFFDDLPDELKEIPIVSNSKIIPINPYDDPRLKLLSYSGRNTLHSCERKYLLSRLGSKNVSVDEDYLDLEAETTKNVTFAYGHAVGNGVQEILQGIPLDTVIWNTFLNWDIDLSIEDEKKCKSLFYAVIAIQTFEGFYKNPQNDLSKYEIATFNDKPAVELPFKVKVGDAWDRGKVDAIVKHKTTGVYAIVEVKTSGYTFIDEASYSNSSQGLGYGIVLDYLAKLSESKASYNVIYLVYASKQLKWYAFVFPKSLSKKAEYLTDLVADVNKVSSGYFPKRGNSCLSFGRRCPFYNNCDLDLNLLIKPLTEEILAEIEKDLERYTFTFDIKDLIENQLNLAKE